MTRRLALRSERLCDLTPAELSTVAGGTRELPTQRCFTGYYPSINARCTTLVEQLTPTLPPTN